MHCECSPRSEDVDRSRGKLSRASDDFGARRPEDSTGSPRSTEKIVWFQMPPLNPRRTRWMEDGP
jgi:hypothetical protein